MLRFAAIFAICAILIEIPSPAGAAENRLDFIGGRAVTVRKAVYTVAANPQMEGSKCLFRNNIQFFCPSSYADSISFEKLIKTKDYDLVIMYNAMDGSGNRWWDWSLVIEDGNKATIKSLADGCLECEMHVERLKPGSNQVDFVYRQKQHQIAARFRAGQLSMRKNRLSSREPLDKQTCDGLYQSLEMCKSNAICSIGGSTAGNFFLLRTEDRFAGFSGEALERQCKAACSTGKAMDRSTFFKELCRRRTPA